MYCSFITDGIAANLVAQLWSTKELDVAHGIELAVVMMKKTLLLHKHPVHSRSNVSTYVGIYILEGIMKRICSWG
jgi:hypothetical protein